MAKKRKLDVDEKCSKSPKKSRKNNDETNLQKHDLANPKNKTGGTTKGDLPDIVTNCVLAKHKKKGSKLSSVDGVDKKGHSVSGFAVETDNKATEVSSTNKRNSCMKRTHQDKVKRKRRKHKAHKSVAVKLPEAAEEISVNWKSLLKTLNPANKAKKKPLTRPETAQKTPEDKPETAPTTVAPEIWFDDVDEIFIERATPIDDGNSSADKVNPLVRPNSFEGSGLQAGHTLASTSKKTSLTKAVAMDCEMVGVGTGGQDSILARVSIVNQFGQCIYDTFVAPTEAVTDYRTRFSGVRPKDLIKAPTFKVVQKKVSDLMKDRILVGHALHNDLQVLFLDHPRKKIRDTARYKPYRSLFNGANPSLKKLTEKVLGVKVQDGEHSSIQDAQAAMRLYTYHKKTWEKDIVTRFKRRFQKKTSKSSDKDNNGAVTMH